MSRRNKYLILFFGAALLAFATGMFIASKALALTTVMSDDFTSYTNGATITDATTYNFANFPGEGTGNCCGNPSTKWEMDTGSFIAQTDSGGGKWGHLPSSDLYRLNTQASSTDAVVTFSDKISVAATASDVWLRFQSQYWLYAVQYDRSDGCIVTKHKIPTNDVASNQWGGIAAGRGGEIANKGVYYVLRIDGDSPSPHGSPCNQDGVDWVNIVPLATTTAVDDATLNGGHVYTYKATITTLHAADPKCGMSFDCVQIQLFRGGALAASWTDKNDGLSQDATHTSGSDCAAGYFNTVTGFQSAWCNPIYASGKSGLRNDDVQDVWVQNFTLADASSTSPPPPPPPPPPDFQHSTSSMYIKNDTVRVNQGTLRIKQ